ncbi:unnamed protein product [Rotaria sp. Silwood2]|nr:unnamed protein product [Rotaria sp. Silwood2]
MSADSTDIRFQTVTNDFINDLKSLSLRQTVNQYSNTIEHLIIQLKNATPNGLTENKPFGLAIVDNFYRIIPIFDKKLLDNNENSYQTNLFLEALSNTFRGFCLLDLFLAIKDSYCLEVAFHNYIPLLQQNYFTHDNTYDHLINCLLPIIAYSSPFITINEADLPSNLLSYLLEFTTKNWQYEQRIQVINNILSLIKVFSRTPTLVPIIIHSEWPNACIQWLKKTGSRPPYATDILINLILQKLARHSIAVEVLNQLNCTNALIESDEQMKKDHNEEDYSCIHFIQCITHALLIEADEHLNTVQSGDLGEEIGGAMETATVIVLIISQEYYDSKSCRQELSYACDTLKKRIVPIYAPNQKYKATGWLGIRIAGQKYVHFGRTNFTNALDELLSVLIVDQKSMAIQKSSNKVTSTKLNEEENSLKNWTSEDIRKWFNDNHIHSDLITLLVDEFHTGTALIVYARHLKQFYQDEYIQILTSYYKIFNGKRLQTLDFITFVDALWRLREEYDPQSKIEDALDKCGKNQLHCSIKNSNEEATCL